MHLYTLVAVPFVAELLRVPTAAGSCARASQCSCSRRSSAIFLAPGLAAAISYRRTIAGMCLA